MEIFIVTHTPCLMSVGRTSSLRFIQTIIIKCLRRRRRRLIFCHFVRCIKLKACRLSWCLIARIERIFQIKRHQLKRFQVSSECISDVGKSQFVFPRKRKHLFFYLHLLITATELCVNRHVRLLNR